MLTLHARHLIGAEDSLHWSVPSQAHGGATCVVSPGFSHPSLPHFLNMVALNNFSKSHSQVQECVCTVLQKWVLMGLLFSNS